MDCNRFGHGEEFSDPRAKVVAEVPLCMITDKSTYEDASDGEGYVRRIRQKYGQEIAPLQAEATRLQGS